MICSVTGVGVLTRAKLSHLACSPRNYYRRIAKTSYCTLYHRSCCSARLILPFGRVKIVAEPHTECEYKREHKKKGYAEKNYFTLHISHLRTLGLRRTSICTMVNTQRPSRHPRVNGFIFHTLSPSRSTASLRASCLATARRSAYWSNSSTIFRPMICSSTSSIVTMPTTSSNSFTTINR